MRKAIVIAALAASVCLLGGCDFIRTLAGRPTSHELAAKREMIEQQAAEVQLFSGFLSYRRYDPDGCGLGIDHADRGFICDYS